MNEAEKDKQKDITITPVLLDSLCVQMRGEANAACTIDKGAK